MDTVLRDIPDTYCYLDDILVASDSEEQHLSDLKAVCARLQENGLFIKPEKCVFGVDNIEYLGHVITSNGVEPLPS